MFTPNTKAKLLQMLALIMVGLTVGIVAHAQVENQFEIGQTVTGASDTTPPSVPTDLSATAVSISQINLSWTASTDDVAVDGYQVFRDTVQIATTTLTSYSDTGLTANTTYVYTVTAFDGADNISAHSATATATTLEEEEEDEDEGGVSGGGPPDFDLVGVQTFPGTNTATLRWRTTRSGISTLSWGRTPDYELGSASIAAASQDHETQITGLTPGTRYYFRIVARDATYSALSDTFTGSFQTLVLDDSEPPGAVTNFRAVGLESEIDLSWTNPPDADFDAVRIVRSTHFFPEGPFDGAVIYEGRGESVVDREVERGVTYYYSAFARDSAGNYASPAVATTRLAEPGAPPTVIEDPFEGFPAAFEPHPVIQRIQLSDFHFYQDGKEIGHDGEQIVIDGSKPIGIAIDYDDLPEVLKTIGVTLTDPDDPNKTFSFLLRVNEDKTQYRATVAPLKRSGTYDLDIVIIDFNNQAQKRLAGVLSVVSTPPALIPDTFLSLLFYLLLLLLLLILVLMIARKFMKNREEGQYAAT